jgi:hypothetical protein
MAYRQAALLRICLSNSIGFSASTAVPIWVGSVGAHFGFTSWGAGATATGQLACAALLNAATPWLFRGAALKKLAFQATTVALLGNGLAWLGSSAEFIAGCLLCGAAFGVLLNVTNRLIAGSSDPYGGYAIVQLVEVLFCIAFFLVVPPIVERFGVFCIFAVLAALCVAVFFLLAGVPISVPDTSPVTAPLAPFPNTGAALLSLCAAALIYAGNGCISSTLVSIGAAVGLSLPWVGRVMALGLLASLGGAVIARGLGTRAGVLWPLLAGAGVLCGAMLVITQGGGIASFIASALVLFIGIVFLSPYMYALLAGLDPAGRWASMAPGFVLTGAASGPGIAGLASHGVDFAKLGYVATACILAAMGLLLCARRLSLVNDRQRNSAAQLLASRRRAP